MAGFAVYTSQYGPVRVDWNDGAVTGLRSEAASLGRTLALQLQKQAEGEL